jgi:acyl-CoA thioesterase I
MRILSLLIAFAFFTFSCGKETPDQPENGNTMQHDYLALGDSYTIGEDVPASGNFPNQLVARLKQKDGINISDPRIIAQTGWRTDQLYKAIAGATEIRDSIFSFVTLCIGVNNQYQNVDYGAYEREFEELYNRALKFTGNKPERIFVLSIPDWAYTRYGQNFTSDPQKITDQINQYNDFNRLFTEKKGSVYIDVTEISRKAFEEPNMLAPDGLHPSEQQYARWVDKMYAQVLGVLQQ